jgi:hypothetical protein
MGPPGFMHMTSGRAAEAPQSIEIVLAHRWLMSFSGEQGDAMKHLNVEWVPDTFASFSLSAAPSPGASAPAHTNGGAQFSAMPASDVVPCTRLIVISDKGKLKADVITEEVNSPGSVPELVEMS